MNLVTKSVKLVTMKKPLSSYQPVELVTRPEEVVTIPVKVVTQKILWKETLK